MKIMQNKVKRKHVLWNEVRIELGDQRVDEAYFSLLSKHPKMSKDRLAYNALKRYYSTTAYRITGELYAL